MATRRFLAGLRDPGAIRDALADYVDMTFEVDILPLADGGPLPLADDESRNLGSDCDPRT